MDNDQIREHLVACAGDWKRVAKETGVDYAWLHRFARGTVEGPGSLVQMLDEYFSQRSNEHSR